MILLALLNFVVHIFKQRLTHISSNIMCAVWSPNTYLYDFPHHIHIAPLN
jgi:hypothetical protein